MATCPTTKADYSEQIKKIILRNSDGITIPKEVREEAYTLAVDIKIVSTRREGYKSYTTTPAESFYGNATLVMQDFTEVKIPVKMPRQRLYYGRVPEAFIHYQSQIDFSYLLAQFEARSEQVVSLGLALGATVTPAVSQCCLPDRPWIELPLREVYFNCLSGTQYELEVTWYKPEGFIDACGNAQNGKSKITDGDKDGGLPDGGVQPSTAPNPSSPFAGLDSPTTEQEQGNFGNAKGQPNSEGQIPLDGLDPSNNPLQQGQWLFDAVFRDYQDIGAEFDYDFSVAGTFRDNPILVDIGYDSPSCPNKTVVNSTFDNRKMMDVGCSSKIIFYTKSFIPT